uniref:Synaptic plasticity regulator PANTS n=1 Tax=Aceria tosichella TaxID=561515 RepID=A0A6G1SEM9_9ACAR
MVILRLGAPVSPEFESEVRDGSNKDALLVRPCERYRELFSSCKSIRGRIHQYYVYGELLDCSPNQDNYNACLNYRKTKDLKFLSKIIEWEKNLIMTRTNAERQNKTWQFRDSPPEDFNGPLPEFLAKRQANSLFNREPEKKPP